MMPSRRPGHPIEKWVIEVVRMVVTRVGCISDFRLRNATHMVIQTNLISMELV